MMATTGMQLAIDAFGPISDNAGGVAEMSGQKPIVRERTDILDSVGNTTAATGKGFAIASAALTSLALFAAYVTFTGIEGINIGGDYPGNAFYDFQKELVKLRSQGIALAISSKNDASIVKKAFNKLNEMPLKLNMFSAMSIGWHEKSLGIKEIANKLNLGLYSILFIDDNEAEIKKVTSNYPELKYLHLPKEPSELVNSLKSNPYIKNISTTQEDINRIESLILVNLKNLSKDKYDLNKYLIDLRIKVFNKLSSTVLIELNNYVKKQINLIQLQKVYS